MRWTIEDERQGEERSPYENAAAACEKVEVPLQENDGSGRLMRYCRAAKRHGLSVAEAIQLVREFEAQNPPPKEWAESKIKKCFAEAKVQSGEAYDDNVVQPARPVNRVNVAETNGHRRPKDEPPFINGGDVLLDLAEDIENDVGEIIFDCGSDLSGFEIGPGKITIVGAPPGTGKTALASQALFAALERHESLVAAIANAEMDGKVLVRRELSRLSGVDYDTVRFAKYNVEQKDRLRDAQKKIRPLMRRTELMQPPFSCRRIWEGIEKMEPGILVVDYLQKFRNPKVTGQEGIEEVMNALRVFAKHNWAVLALSSTARQEGKGSKHDSSKLDMGSFRGSGEIEFQADAAYVLRRKDMDETETLSMELKCVKNRHGRPESLDLKFIPSEMRFETHVQPHDFGAYSDEDEF